MKKSKQISVIIPALNEAATIKKVLAKVLDQPEVAEIIVVNDGSTDKTIDIVKLAANKKIKIINHQNNLGKGRSVIDGIKKAKKDYILIQDADLEYNPEEYKKLLAKANLKNVVYGSRIINGNPHAYQRTYFGNVLITAMCNLLYGTNLTDSYTCYKLMPTKIAKSLNLKSNGFEIEAEITAKLAKNNIPIIEVPISYSPRKYEEGKKIKALDAFKGAWMFLKMKFSED